MNQILLFNDLIIHLVPQRQMKENNASLLS